MIKIPKKAEKRFVFSSVEKLIKHVLNCMQSCQKKFKRSRLFGKNSSKYRYLKRKYRYFHVIKHKEGTQNKSHHSSILLSQIPFPSIQVHIRKRITPQSPLSRNTLQSLLLPHPKHDFKSTIESFPFRKGEVINTRSCIMSNSTLQEYGKSGCTDMH